MDDSDATVPSPKPTAHAGVGGVPSPSQVENLMAAGAGAFEPQRNSRPQGWNPPSTEELRKLLPQYEISGFIAHGGMGAVYKGMQKTLKRAVAIKILPPEIEDGDMQFKERFKHEAQAMARLSHPNIVAVFDAGETADGLLYFVMEFIEGTDVAQLIASDGALDPKRAVSIITAVCDALAFAHEEGIIHRDIKPSNIMLDSKGRVKVADFGLAKAVNVESTLLTGSNVAMGTPDFIAPESFIPGIKLDQRADIYAVGVMLYQMLTGHVPRGRFQLPSAVVPKLDHRLDSIVDKAMQTDREQRYSTAIKMKTEVEKVVPGFGPHSSDPSPRPGLKPRTSLLTAAALAIGIIAVVGIIFGLREKQSSPVLKPGTALASVPSAPPNIKVNEKAAGTREPETFRSHRYQFVSGANSWAEAKVQADVMGGHLATIDSREEDEWLKQTCGPYAMAQGSEYIHLGGTVTGNVGRWVTGEPFTYTGWLPGQPNGGGTELSLQYWFKEGQWGWDDRAPGTTLSTPFIVEWDKIESANATVATATKDTPYVNTLGMKFVPVPIAGGPTSGQRVLFSIWETRNIDYGPFAEETLRPWTPPGWSDAASVVKMRPFYAATAVSWQDAMAYASWLTARERKAGRLGVDQGYRLPTDHEWSCAVGIGAQEDAAKPPLEKDAKIAGVYPWGIAYPPPAEAGNFADEAFHKQQSHASKEHFKGYDDGYAEVAPVGMFQPNNLGLYDLAGNALEWCMEKNPDQSELAIMRSSCWGDGPESNARHLLSSFRGQSPIIRHESSNGFRLVLAPVASPLSQPPGRQASPSSSLVPKTGWHPPPGPAGLVKSYEFADLGGLALVQDDRRMLLSGQSLGADWQLMLIDLETGKPIWQRLTRTGDRVLGLPGGSDAVRFGRDKDSVFLHRVELTTGKDLSSWRLPHETRGAVQFVALSQDARHLCAAIETGLGKPFQSYPITVWVFDLNSLKPVAEWNLQSTMTIKAFAWLDANKFVLSFAGGGEVSQCLNFDLQHQDQPPKPHPAKLWNGVALVPEGPFLAGTSVLKNTLALVPLSGDPKPAVLRDNFRPSELSFSDGTMIAVQNRDDGAELCTFDPKAHALLASLRMPVKLDNTVISHDGSFAIARQIDPVKQGPTGVVGLYRLRDASASGAAPAKGGDRAAAQWVLGLGGTVTIKAEGKMLYPKTAAELPAGKFLLISLKLENLRVPANPPFSLAPLTHLPELGDVQINGAIFRNELFEPLTTLPKLKTLSSHFTNITDDIVELLKRMPALTELDLGHNKTFTGRRLGELAGSSLDKLVVQDCAIADEGIRQIASLRRLKFLDLLNTKVSDDAVAMLTSLNQLETLYLHGSQVTATGFAKLGSLTRLRSLGWNVPPVDVAAQVARVAAVFPHLTRFEAGLGSTPEGVAALAAFRELTRVDMGGGTVTDEMMSTLLKLPQMEFLILDLPSYLTDTGLGHLASHPALQEIFFDRARLVTDAGLLKLAALKPLKKLRIKLCEKITPAGLDAFAKARPDVKIDSDIPTSKPTNTATKGDDRAAAQWVLELGGTVKIKADGKEFSPKTAAELPAGAFVVTQLALEHPRVPAGQTFSLVPLAGLPELAQVKLMGLIFRGEMLAPLTTLPKLRELECKYTSLTDDFLDHVKRMPALTTLTISRTQNFTGRRLGELAGSSLDKLVVQDCAIADEGIRQIASLRRLKYLDLTDMKITDDSLAVLASLDQLENLSLNKTSLTKTSVTAPGLVRLAPLTRLRSMVWSVPSVDAAAQVARVAAVFPHLTRFGVGLGSTPEGVAALAAFRELNRVDLTPDDEMMPALLKLPRIEFLVLNGPNQITDTGLAHLAKHPVLKDIILDQSRLITDAGLFEFTALKSLKKLKIASTCEKITPAGIAAFAKARPDVKIER